VGDLKMKLSLAYVFLLFLMYSFIGYICEIICSSIAQKKLVNRGFLCGPYCPIYGIGSLFVLAALLRFKSDPVLVFILGAIITSALEYFTSFLLEKIFHNKWWDYDNYKGNINGRICLQNTLLFGLGSLVIIYMGDPFTTKVLGSLSSMTINITAICFAFIFIIDCVYSFIIAYNLRNRIIICEELKNEKISKIPGMLEKLIKERVANFKTYPKRLLDAFPDLKKANYKEFELMKKIREKSKNKRKK
jgi:uncharacterized membrane protein